MQVVRTLDDARQAVRRIATEKRSSLTAMGHAAGLARGVITRFTSGEARNERRNRDGPVDIRLSSLLTYLEYAGYEIVIRPRNGSNERERRRNALRQENNSGSGT